MRQPIFFIINLTKIKKSDTFLIEKYIIKVIAVNYTKKLIFAFMFIIFSSLFSKEIVENSKDLKIKKLDNGITYYYYKNKKLANRVSINVIIKAGSLQEEENQKGIAHFLEHMTFNGTKNYEKNGIVKYFESIGLSFGGDLNAHTSFYETVYKLHLPTDDREKFEKGVEILKEMVFDASLTDEDINNEKEIIVEEWRLSQGFRERITNFWKKALYDNSRYVERFPIGDMEIIKNSDHNLMKSYYDKWYRAKNISVVVVGDIDQKYAEKTIKKYFEFPDTKPYTAPESYSLKELPTDYLIFRDKEIVVPEFIMATRMEKEKKYTEESIKESLAYDILKNLIKNRFDKKSFTEEKPLFSGSMSDDLYMNDNIITISSVMDENKIELGVKTSIEILKYIKDFGVTDVELSLEKENILKTLESEVRNKEAFVNSLIVKDITNSIVNNDIFLDVNDTLSIFKKYSSKITMNDIKNVAKKIYEDNTRFILLLPEKDEINITEKDFENIVNKAKNSNLEKDKDVQMDINLKEPLLQVGSVKSVTNKGNYREILLSNGMKVLFKETNLKENQIYLRLFREGGTSNLSYTDTVNSLLASNLIKSSGVENINLETINAYYKGKNFTISPKIRSYAEEITIISDKQSLNEAMKYFSYLVRKPKLSSNLYETNMNALKLLVKNRDNEPQNLFEDKMVELLFDNHPKKTSIKEGDIEYLSEENMLEVFSKKFKNFDGYTGIVVGSIKEKDIIPILEKYFASLPTDIPRESSWQDIGLEYPSDIVCGEVIKGNDKKILVDINYPIHKPFTPENKVLTSAVAKIMRITFVEEIREKISGVYGISVSPRFSKYEKGYLNIFFSTDPKKEKMVLDKLHFEINKILHGYINLKALDSIKENYKLSYENNLKMSEFWLEYLTKKSYDDDYKYLTPEEYNSLVTEENIRNFQKELLKNDNYIQVILYPENEK